MTKEEKQLLLIDLCARLPYDVQISKTYARDDNSTYISEPHLVRSINRDCVILVENEPFLDGTPDIDAWAIEDVKPYLRPMSSMTEEEDARRCAFLDDIEGGIEDAIFNYIDWLNAHHFDYRGLIEKGLALEAPKDMYKFD